MQCKRPKTEKLCELDTLSLMRRKVCESPIIKINSLNINCSSLKDVNSIKISGFSIRGNVPSLENENSSQNSLEKNPEIGQGEPNKQLSTKIDKM